MNKNKWRKLEPFRVQIPPYTDRWMMGDRYGSVLAEQNSAQTLWQVLLDKSNKLFVVIADDCVRT